MKIIFVAACAVLDADHRVLLARRPKGKMFEGLWELPGGKVELNERPEAALIRELKEEVNITVKEECLAPLAFASHAYEEFHLFMPVWVCRRWGGPERALEGQELAWVRSQDLRQYPMPPADLPLIPVLKDLL
jgi:8-oxo-dGTP diphosphatase